MLKPEVHNKLYRFLLPAVIVSLPFHVHVNVACIALLIVNWLIEGDYKAKWQELKQDQFFILSALLYIWYIIQLLFTHHPDIGRFEIEQKAALLCLPLVLLSRKAIIAHLRPLFFNAHILAATGALLICLLLSTYQFTQTGDAKVFVYHALANQIGLSAIYLSMLCVAAALYIQVNLNQQFLKFKKQYFGLLIFLSLGILLLASKTQIVVYAVLSLGVVIYQLRNKKGPLFISVGVFALVALLLLTTDNPIRKRFNDIRGISEPMMYQKDFSPDIYFDGMAIRVVLARFGFEILQENNAYILGISPGDNRALLNDKIKEHNLYTGDDSISNHGYLNYNYHNQYMEVLMACGIIGLLLLVLIMGYLLYICIVHRQSELLLFVLLYAACFVTESVLEREVGIVSFSLFFSVLLASVKPKLKN